MRYYETLYILNPEYEQERIDNILKEVEEEASKFSKVINHSVWNKKRLALQYHRQYPRDLHPEVILCPLFNSFWLLNYLITQAVNKDMKLLIHWQNLVLKQH